MNKIMLLKEKAIAFRTLLELHQNSNADAMLMLKWLTPLFREIDLGKVVPPKHYEFRSALGRESSFDAPDSPFSHPHSEFQAALEDWASQPWYQEALQRSERR